ncbi:MAG: general secretion pathway protein GspF [Chromatiales bacterium]|nr:general secretion pathway protein GspF [Chromatiales bacterium]
MTRRKKTIDFNAPLRHPDHPRPVTRRQFIAQGFMTGAATIVGGGVFSLFANPREAFAALSGDLQPLTQSCGISVQGAGKIPFICFDLAGGANMVGSNVLGGRQGGQLDFISTQGYSRQGLPGDMIPPAINPLTGQEYIDDRLGLRFHADSAFMRGITERLTPGVDAFVNGALIPARSENDTGNNPHNPMYGINRAGADGSLLTLIGSRPTDSGGNSLAPAAMINPEVRPTKVDRPTDVTGLVDTGQLVGLLGQEDAVAVMESIYRISDRKLTQVSTGLNSIDPNTGITRDEVIKDLVRCGYLRSADIADRFGDPSTLNPALDPDIVGANGIFSAEEFNADPEFRKTASVMKLVMNGFAGAGCITMGGYDYHGGRRALGEVRDLRAGRCMGACLEYAARLGVPLMLYVFSDGSLSSNGVIDNSEQGRGKGEWTSDNQSTAASFILVYNPNGRAQLLGATPEQQERHRQIGWFRPDGSVETASSPAANNVNLLAEMVVLNYMALHGEQGNFTNLFPNHGLGGPSLRDSLTAFAPIVNGTISG